MRHLRLISLAALLLPTLQASARDVIEVTYLWRAHQTRFTAARRVVKSEPEVQFGSTCHAPGRPGSTAFPEEFTLLIRVRSTERFYEWEEDARFVVLAGGRRLAAARVRPSIHARGDVYVQDFFVPLKGADYRKVARAKHVRMRLGGIEWRLGAADLAEMREMIRLIESPSTRSN